VRGERTRAGMEAAKAKALREGVVWKRGGVQKGSHYKVSYAQIRVIRQMKLNGEPISQIAKALSLSRPTVYKILAQYPD
jgi:DNA invertase Pin-like site-specific DNA recombinase